MVIRYNPVEIEKRMLKFWDKNKIFEKLMKKNKGKKLFSFLDGPITANNPMGVHHAWGRALKDLFQRFKAMQGFDQRYQNGFDCQGLWVEVEVEKELGFNSKKDIEKFGIENFSKACRERVNKFSKKQIEQSIRLGQWMDWKDSYYTYDDKNIEAIWYFLKKCHERGWLYKGTKVLPWCIRCGTSSSKHEMSDEGWAKLTHPGLFVKFPLKERNKEYLLVWTTTAWTLTSNVAAAVHIGLNYVKVKVDDETFYLSEGTKDRLGKKYVVIERMKGKDLIGLEYGSPYGNFSAQKDVVHKVVGWEEVNEEEGTGIVHIAPGCGEEDQELGKRENLKEIAPLDEFGNFIEGFGWLTGKNVSGIAKEIIEDLKKRNFLFKVEDYTHRYPVCWRCKEELVFRLGKEWFISSDEIRPLMKKEAKKIRWYPEFSGKMMQDWLNNMGDWNISRKRYWGLPLMFFECECGNLEVIESLKELRGKAVDKKEVDKLPELHRPWIDKIKIRCSKCGKEVERIKEVGDCWLDAGIVPFSTMKYFEDKRFWKKWFPAELISEYIAQVKLWYYATLFMSITLEGVAPYQSVLTTVYVVDEKGNPMHKTAGNVIWFDDAIEKIGADVMRWMYTTQNPKFNLNFGYTPAREIQRILNILHNTAEYVKTYCEANNFKPKKTRKLDLASRWIISRMESLKATVTDNLENLRYHVASKAIEDFFLYDFSRWYIHIIRPRIKPGYEAEDKHIALHTLYKVMLDLLKLLAPFTPFLTEQSYQDFFRKFEKKESIHLSDWPAVNKKLIDKKLEEKMDIIKKTIEACYSARQSANIKLRWPVKRVVICTKDKKVAKAVKDLNKILVPMCNAKKIVATSRKSKGKFAESKFNFGSVLVDTELGKKLLDEALIKELTREVQSLRKKHGFVVKESIVLTLNSDKKTNKILGKHIKTVKKEVGAAKVVIGKPTGRCKGKLKFKNTEIEIAFEKK